MTSQIDLTPYGIDVKDIRRNLAPATLYQEALRTERDSVIANSGALIAYSGSKTGRSPNDKRVVKHQESSDDIWWGSVNIAIDQDVFETNRERAIDFLNTREYLYVITSRQGKH